MRTHVPTRNKLAAALLSCLGLMALAGCAGPDDFSSRPVNSSSASENGDVHLGESALNSGSLQMAASLFEKTLQTNPDSLEAMLGLGDVAYRSGDMERARLIYLQAEKRAPKEIGPKIGLARVEVRKRHLDEAIAIYRKVLVIQPDDPTASAGMGTALDLQGHHTEAQAVYRQALLAHPDSQSVRIDLGLSLVLSHKAREGANVLIDVVNLPDAPAEARYDLALAFGVIGNTEAAKRILSRDLPAANVEDNLRFYAALRKTDGENPAAAPAENSMAAAMSEPAAASPVAPVAVGAVTPLAGVSVQHLPLTQLLATPKAGLQ